MSGFVIRVAAPWLGDDWPNTWLTPRDEKGLPGHSKSRLDAEVFPTEEMADRAIPWDLITTFNLRYLIEPAD